MPDLGFSPISDVPISSAPWVAASAGSVPVSSWGSPRYVLVGTSPTYTPTNTGGTADGAEEVAGATNVLADANLKIDATTGVITAIDGSGATPLGDYSFRVRQTNAAGNGNTYTQVLHVVSVLPGSGDGGAYRASPVRQTPARRTDVRTSAVR